MTRSYYVLKEQIPADAVVATLSDPASPWAGRALEVQMREVSSVLRNAVFRTASSSTTVGLVGDDTAQTLYLAIEGDDRDEARALAQIVESRLPIAALEELLSAASERYQTEPHLLIRLALGTTAIPDPKLLDLLAKAAKDANPEVRKAAINALGLTQWLRAFAPLEDREAHDAEPALREFARLTIHSLRLALGMEQ